MRPLVQIQSPRPFQDYASLQGQSNCKLAFIITGYRSPAESLRCPRFFLTLLTHRVKIAMGAGSIGERRNEMNVSKIFRKVCFAGIGAIEFSREQLSDARKTLKDSLKDFVKRGELLNEREDSLTKAFFAAIQIKGRVPSAKEVNSIIPGYDDLTVTEILDQVKKLTMKQLETISEYESHNFNRIRVIRQIDRELDEVRIIPEYDTLAVPEVLERLDDLNPQELAALKDYEKSHRNRATVIKAIDRRLKKAA
jgi:hypothetical protein